MILDEHSATLVYVLFQSIPFALAIRLTIFDLPTDTG